MGSMMPANRWATLATIATLAAASAGVVAAITWRLLLSREDREALRSGALEGPIANGQASAPGAAPAAAAGGLDADAIARLDGARHLARQALGAPAAR